MLSDEENQDDFGDFEDTTTADGADFTFRAPEPTYINRIGLPSEEAKLKQFELQDEGLKPAFASILKNIAEAYPIEHIIPIDDEPSEIFKPYIRGKLLELSEAFQDEDWASTFRGYQSENIYTDSNVFKWETSEIRTKYLEELEKKTKKAPKVSDSVVTTVNPPIEVRASDNGDKSEKDLAFAKGLCNVPEDEIRQKSDQEVVEFVSILSSSLTRMQEQANFWLDVKEQLVMESEMQNKMIASLVNFAKKKQQSQKPTKK